MKQSISGNYELSPISVQAMSEYISVLKSNKAVQHDVLYAAFLKCSGDNLCVMCSTQVSILVIS